MSSLPTVCGTLGGVLCTASIHTQYLPHAPVALDTGIGLAKQTAFSTYKEAELAEPISASSDHTQRVHADTSTALQPCQSLLSEVCRRGLSELTLADILLDHPQKSGSQWLKYSFSF